MQIEEIVRVLLMNAPLMTGKPTKFAATGEEEEALEEETTCTEEHVLGGCIPTICFRFHMILLTAVWGE
jgi:hypothetical protein